LEPFTSTCPKVMLNKEEISTALVNIIILNGIEALEGRPNPKVRVESYFKSEKSTVKISDNGMDEELQAKLFEPFYTAKTNGMELGLVYTLGILKAYNAEIEVKSEVAIGFEFIIRFYPEYCS
jgi:C4-dicarboxylate-specific signal transduction histidine kinase